MPVLAEWVKQLVTVLILIGFLEFILPDNELKGATKLVMGLFIITLLMQPLGKVLKMPDQFGRTKPLTAFSQDQSQDRDTNRLINQGLKLRETWEKSFAARDQAFVKERLSSILGIIGQFKIGRVDVEFRNAEPIRVKVLALPSGWRRDSDLEAELTGRIRNAVRLVTNVTLNNIEVKWNAAN